MLACISHNDVGMGEGGNFARAFGIFRGAGETLAPPKIDLPPMHL